LCLAAEKGRDSICAFLLEIGAKLSAVDKNGRTAFHWAAQSSKYVVSLFLEKGADINAVDKDDMTALHIALEKSSESIAEFLLEKGINPPKSITMSGKTLLHYACMTNMMNYISSLLEKPGVDIEAVDNLQWSKIILKSN